MSDRRARHAVLAFAFAALAAAPALAAEERFSLEDWIAGPVRYLAQRDETRVYRGLGTDEERALFIEQFWIRRDPQPETLVNEYRQLFWERVNEANRLFMDSSKPGWMTDRGKIYILYGPPTEIQEEHDLRTEGIAGGGYGLIRWVYEGRPQDRSDMDPVVVVPFVRDGSGEYRVSYDPNLASVFFDANALREAKYNLGAQLRASNAGAGRSTLSVMLDLGKMQEVPPQEQVLIERVETAEAYRNEPVDVAVDRFRHPDTGGTVLSISVDLSHTSEEERPAIMARLRPENAPERMRILGEDSFRLDERFGRRVAQGRIVVDPGTYKLTVLVADPVRVATALHNEVVEVRESPAERPQFSDIVLASDLESLPYQALVSYDEPYIVGPFRLVPRFNNSFEPGETVRLFYEVYGTQQPITVSYQLEGQELDGRWIKLGQPAVAEQAARSQGWEITTGENWPPGDYRIRIDVVDAEGRLITAETPFRLQPPVPHADPS